MKKQMLTVTTLCLFYVPASADTNALIEVKLFKDWVIKGECDFGNLAIKNTGTEPILLFKNPVDFEGGQLLTRPLPRNPYADRSQENHYQVIQEDGEFFNLLSEETHVYEGRKFHLGDYRYVFSDEMRFTVSIYLGKGFWLDSEPLTVKGVIPDSEEDVAIIKHNELARQGKSDGSPRKLVLVTYKNERWLYVKSLPISQIPNSGGAYYPVCPVSLTNKIRVESYDDALLFKILDGENSMIFHMTKSILTEGPDENNVLGKWTRERKQRAEADNAEVRRKKAEAQAQ